MTVFLISYSLLFLSFPNPNPLNIHSKFILSKYSMVWFPPWNTLRNFSMQSNVHICHFKCCYDLLHYFPNFFCDKFGKSDKICSFEQTILSKQITNSSGFWIGCIIETCIENNKKYSEINSLPSGLDLSTSPKSEVCVYITSDQVAIDGK